MAFILLPVKLSFADTLRHRHSMFPFRYRDDPPYIYAEEEDESSSRSALYIAIGIDQDTLTGWKLEDIVTILGMGTYDI